jgi:hypothetical protein
MKHLLDDGFDVVGRSVWCRHKSGGRARASWGLLGRMKSVQTVQLTIRNKKSTTLACDDWSIWAHRPRTYNDVPQLPMQARTSTGFDCNSGGGGGGSSSSSEGGGGGGGGGNPISSGFLAFDRSYGIGSGWIQLKQTSTFYNRELVLMVDVTSRPVFVNFRLFFHRFL